MAAETSRLKWPYPREFEDPWYDSFVSFAESVDASVYTTREDRSSVLMDGGTVAFNISGLVGTLTWSQPIRLLSAVAGFLLSTADTTADLLDGEMLYALVTRAPTNSGVLTLARGRQLPNTNDAVLLAVRSGATVYWRNGKVINNGDSVALFTSNGGGGGGGNYLRQDGTNSPTANISWAGFRLTDLPTPAAPAEAATKGYVDSATPTGVIKADGSVAFTADQSMGNHKLTSLATPTNPADAATKDYVDSATPTGVIKADGSVAFTADQSMGSHKLTGLATPTNPSDATTKAYVDSVTPTGVIKADGSVAFTADQPLGNHKLTGLATPTNPTDAATMAYADGVVTGYLTTSIAASTYVPLSRTVTGSAPVTVNADNIAHDLTSNLTIAIVMATNLLAGAVSTASQTFAGTKTFNGGVVVATGQSVSGAAELNLNAATANSINFNINNVTVARISSDGSLQIGTNVTPLIPNLIVLKNGTGVVALTNIATPGTQVPLMFFGSNDVLELGDPFTGKAVRLKTGVRGPWRGVADTATTIAETDGIVAYTSLTVTRIATLPSASVVGAGFSVTVKDESGSASASVKISVVPPTGTIEGAASVDISVARGWATFYSNGSAWFQL